MATSATQAALVRLFNDGEAAIFADWVKHLSAGDSRISAQEAQSQGKELLHALGKALGPVSYTHLTLPTILRV